IVRPVEGECRSLLITARRGDRDAVRVQYDACRGYPCSVDVGDPRKVLPGDEVARAVERNAGNLIIAVRGRDRDTARIQHDAAGAHPRSVDVTVVHPVSLVLPDDQEVRAIEGKRRCAHAAHGDRDPLRVEHGSASVDSSSIDTRTRTTGAAVLPCDEV